MNKIVLSGQILLQEEVKFKFIGYPPSRSEYSFEELFDNSIMDHNPEFIQCSCNNHSFFILFQYIEDDKKYLKIAIFDYPINNKYSNQSKEREIAISDDISQWEYKKQDISLFCSDNYIFFSILYKTNEKKKFRHTVLSQIKRSKQETKYVEKYNNECEIIEKAFDFCGNNNNFAFFIFNEFKNGDNKIVTFNLQNNELEERDIILLGPSDDINFYNRHYIKMIYHNDNLYLIGANQKSIENIFTFEKYSFRDISTITNVFTIDKLGPIRVLNICGEEKYDRIIFNDDFSISIEPTYITQDKNNNEKYDISDIFRLYSNYDDGFQPSDWIRAKNSCIFHSTAYLSRDRKEIKKKKADISSIFQNQKNFGKIKFSS